MAAGHFGFPSYLSPSALRIGRSAEKGNLLPKHIRESNESNAFRRVTQYTRELTCATLKCQTLLHELYRWDVAMTPLTCNSDRYFHIV